MAQASVPSDPSKKPLPIPRKRTWNHGMIRVPLLRSSSVDMCIIIYPLMNHMPYANKCRYTIHRNAILSKQFSTFFLGLGMRKPHKLHPLHLDPCWPSHCSHRQFSACCCQPVEGHISSWSLTPCSAGTKNVNKLRNPKRIISCYLIFCNV